MPQPTTKKKRKGRKQQVPEACRIGLSNDMKDGGDRKQAMANYWDCRREHEHKKPPKK
jgi:hypothetical protein